MPSSRQHLSKYRNSNLAMWAILILALLKAEVADSAADYCDPAAVCKGLDGSEGYGGCVSQRLAVCKERCLGDEFPVYVKKDL